jgi:hypothetical protein
LAYKRPILTQNKPVDWIWASRGRDIFSGGADYSADQDDDAARDVFLTRSTPLSLSLLHLPARLTTPKTMTKILLTGATGYIGGTILSTLLRDNHEGVSYGVLIRNAKASDAYEARSITLTSFKVSTTWRRSSESQQSTMVRL